MALRILAAAALALAVAPAASAGVRDDARTIRAGLARAADAGRLETGEAARHRTTLARALRLVDRLPPERAGALRAAVGVVARHAGWYTRPRALTLFGMLDANVSHLAGHRVPAPGTDVEGADGVVYRAVKGKGLQFHPLANFARLNARLAAGRDGEAAALATALVARGVRRGQGLVWEYPFRFWNVRPPWTSGMAQAVAAQALARAGRRFGDDPELLDAARRAFLAVPRRLTLEVDGGPWVRLYGRLGLVVLNAQLQAALSLDEYAEIVGDARADAFARELRSAATVMLPRFDTGYWSLYAPGREATLAYHRYVVSLLHRLAARTDEPQWREAAVRFARYADEPPVLRAGGAGPALYPLPRDGHRDEGRFRFWTSKGSTVRLVVDGRRRLTVWADRGWNTVRWRPGERTAAGEHAVRIEAVGRAGNRAELELPPLVVRRDAEPPQVSAEVAKGRLWWGAGDEGSGRVRLSLRLMRGDTRRTVALGARPLRGSWRLRLPPGRWWAVLEARDAAGNRARVPLGRIA